MDNEKAAAEKMPFGLILNTPESWRLEGSKNQEGEKLEGGGGR